MAKPGDFDFYCEVALKDGAGIDIVTQNDLILAFHHTKPSYERHIVIVPKEHIHDIRFVEDDQLFVEIMKAARDILRDWGDQYINANGARIDTNLGIFQDTPHLHVHVIGGKKIR